MLTEARDSHQIYQVLPSNSAPEKEVPWHIVREIQRGHQKNKVWTTGILRCVQNLSRHGLENSQTHRICLVVSLGATEESIHGWFFVNIPSIERFGVHGISQVIGTGKPSDKGSTQWLVDHLNLTVG